MFFQHFQHNQNKPNTNYHVKGHDKLGYIIYSDLSLDIHLRSLWDDVRYFCYLDEEIEMKVNVHIYQRSANYSHLFLQCTAHIVESGDEDDTKHRIVLV